MQIDIGSIVIALASTGVLGMLITVARGAARHWTGRERREQASIRVLKAERDAEWRRRIRLGDAYARARYLAAEAGADPAELAMLDQMLDGLDEDEARG